MSLPKLTPNSSVEWLRKNFTKSARERKRTSERRRKRLEKLARWISGKKVKVRYQNRGAKCQPAPHGSTHDMDVYVPTDEHEQPTTDLPDAVWDFVFQKAELVHELGHVLYTDFEAMEDYGERIADMHEKQLFHNLFNIVEDGAIERQLAASYNVGNDLEIKNRNLMMLGDPGIKRGDGRELTFAEAIETVLMDWAKWDSGRATKLLDPSDDDYVFTDAEDRERVIEMLPSMKANLLDVVSEPDPRERVRITYEWFIDIKPEFEDADALSGDPLMGMMQNFPDDGNVYVVLPGDPPDDAEAIEPDEDDVVIHLGRITPEEDPDIEPGGDYEAAIEADDEGDNIEDGEAWLDACKATGHTLLMAGEGDVQVETLQKGKKYGKRYRDELRRVLQRQRNPQTVHNQRAGRPDPQSLWQLGYGKSRVFSNEREPEDKDYAVVLLLDRSGSMGGDVGTDWIVDEAEAVVYGLSWALEELGVDVAVISIAGDAYLEKSFDESTEDAKRNLCRGYSYGGTPLGKALDLAQARLDRMNANPLVFSVTDGEPTDNYDNVLAEVTFPVVGVYFQKDTPDIGDVRQYYHRIKASNKADLSRNVEGLIKQMVV